jgi:rsbT antagonist protein RsbS
MWVGGTPVQESDARVVLQLLHGVAVVPMPDPVGSDYFAELNKHLLDFLQRESVGGIILDMSGIEVLDLVDFTNIHKVWKTTHLMGTPLVMAGMKPGVAAALTMLNVDDTWVRSAMSVEQAMEFLR